jgi:uncharacterized protein (DUF488 family)
VKDDDMPAGQSIFTIGHSNRSLEEFLAVLAEAGVGSLVDIRRYPGSKRHPHFARDNLGITLEARGIHYVHMPDLGGYRQAPPDVRGVDGLEEQWRGYGAYMQTAAFAHAESRV